MTHLEKLRRLAYANGMLARAYSDIQEWSEAGTCACIASKYIRLMRLEVLLEAAFRAADREPLPPV